MPKRIQYKRGQRKPPGCKIVTRISRWGNPFRVEQPATPETHAVAIAQFEEWVNAPEQADLRERAKKELAGFDLACACPPGWPCHAGVWLRFVNDS